MYRPGLVDLAAGQISREIFVNDAIYQEELERVFARAWLFVGHESQIPNPGDFFVSSMGEESVILCRDLTGEIHVFLNSCRHRGMKVCRYDEGSTAVFTCPYHGWSYGTDGRLVGVPFFREAYHSQLDRARWGLVDHAAGRISREIFVNEEIYREELERVFARSWLFVGHESQIPKPGDFFVSSMGEESVILCRGRAGQIHVFLNSCRHRGMKVCRYDEGSTAVFTCPYHGWSYSTDGRLVGVPYFRAYRSQLDRSQWGLVEVAQLCNYKGSVWATWDPAAPPFLEYLGEFAT